MNNPALQDYLVINDKEATLKINAEIYTKETLLHALYVLLDYTYVFVDKKENYYLLLLKSKGRPIQDIVDRVFDELIEAQAYLMHQQSTKEVRKLMLEKALASEIKTTQSKSFQSESAAELAPDIPKQTKQ